MGQLLVRNVDDDLIIKLRYRARRHGRTVASEVLEILRSAVCDEALPETPLGTRLAARFRSIGLDEEIPELRGQPPRPPVF